MTTRGNPFEITKAVDLTDQEIAATFVDLPIPGGGFGAIADPRSPMPHFLVGGKGGGRTHLMRHLSHEVQTLGVAERYGFVVEQGYIGVYMRCSGLNSNRFHGKRKPEDMWDAVFSYHMDLWIAHSLISVLEDIGRGVDCPWTPVALRRFCEGAQALFDDDSGLGRVESLSELHRLVERLLREIDRAVNNAVFADTLEVVIRSTPGKLPFGIADLIASENLSLAGVRIAFLLDELENLDASQQRYVQTLVREKVLSVGFVIGSRRYGLRTFETLSAGEENKQGSEYELTVLEEVYAGNPKAFREFCKSVALARVRQAQPDFDTAALERMFGEDEPSAGSRVPIGLEQVLETPSLDRQHMKRLREVLRQVVGSDAACESIASVLEVQDDPVLEKLAILRFYYDWSPGKAPTLATADGARKLIRDYSSGLQDRKALQFVKHHRNDMVAQLYHENTQRQPYLGFGEFVEMSGFLPRSLLVVLKNVVRWAEFVGEEPLPGVGSVSRRAQSEGVLEASRWFLGDSLPDGPMRLDCELAVRRLGGYLRRMRMSDKPVEVECAAFSTDLAGVSESAIETLNTCVKHSLIVNVAAGQIDRNSGSVHYKYQLNPMLAPMFELPTSRRGVVKLSAPEVVAVFDSSIPDERFHQVTRARLRAFSAPFSEPVAIKEQGELF